MAETVQEIIREVVEVSVPGPQGPQGVPGDISSTSPKTTPVDADAVLISDSAAAGAPKLVTLANLGVWVGTKIGALLGPAIAALTGKTTPVAADTFTISDSAAAGVSKKVTFANLYATILAALGPSIAGTTAKGTIVAGDNFLIGDSAAANANKSVLASVLKTFVTTSPTITGGSINNTPIGATTPNTGAFTTLTTTGNVQISSTDAGAGIGPNLDLFRNSASPAVSDLLGYFGFSGKTSTGATATYADMYASILNPVNGAIDGQIDLRVVVNNVATTRLTLNTTGAVIAGTLTATSVAGAMVATQAEQETATATDRIVSPGRQHFHPSAAKAWVKFDASSGTPTIASSYNITSLTDAGVGLTTVNINVDMSSAANCVPMVSAGNSGSVQCAHLAGSGSISAGAFQIATAVSSSQVATDCSAVTGIVYGDI